MADLKDTLGEDFGKLYDQEKQSDDIAAARYELKHMLVAVEEWTGSLASITWAERYAQTVFFGQLSEYYAKKEPLNDQIHTGLSVNISPSLDGTVPVCSTFRCKGSTLWRLSLIVYGPGKNGALECVRYTPKSDFFASVSDIPQIIVEVDSKGSDDRSRMLAQGASVVRLVNTITQSQDFVLLALYFAKGNPDIMQYLIYQDSDDADKTVCNSRAQRYVIG